MAIKMRPTQAIPSIMGLRFGVPSAARPTVKWKEAKRQNCSKQHHKPLTELAWIFAPSAPTEPKSKASIAALEFREPEFPSNARRAAAAPTPTSTAMAKFPIHEMRGESFASSEMPNSNGTIERR